MRKFTVYGLLIFLIGIGVYMLICSYTYSVGSRTGILMKFSKKGFIFKTYEGDINVGFINTNMAGLTANVFHFSVEKKEKKAINFLENAEGKLIKIHYKEKLKAMPWQGEKNYLIYDVEYVKKSEFND
jgi:hypothetical protein